MAELGSILLADDEDAFRQMTAEVLRRDGYDCHCASDGHRAAEMLRANRYHLLIADIKMPGNAKLELVRETQQLARGMPVILVTAEQGPVRYEVAYWATPLPDVKGWQRRSTGRRRARTSLTGSE